MKLTAFIVLAYFLASCKALFEDQIGKFDWLKPQIGKVQLVEFESSVSPCKRIFLYTEENVVAGVNAKNGTLVWRKALSETDGNIIQLISVKDGLVTVSDTGIVRLVQAANGVPKWESNVASSIEKREDFRTFQATVLEQKYTEGNLLVVLSSHGLHTLPLSKHRMKLQSLATNQPEESSLNQKLLVDSQNGRIILIQLVPNTGLTVQVIDPKEMEESSHSTVRAPLLKSLRQVAFLEGHQIVFTSGLSDDSTLYLANLNTGEILNSVKLALYDIEEADSIFNSQSSDLSNVGQSFLLKDVNGMIYQFSIDDTDIKLGWKKEISAASEVSVKSVGTESYVYFVVVDGRTIVATAANLKTGAIDEDVTVNLRLPQNTGRPEQTHINMFLKRTSPVGFRLLVTTTADTVLFVSQPNRVLWQRDEALATIKHAIMLDLPLSDSDAGIEAEFDKTEKTGVIAMFFRRVKAQSSQLLSFLRQLAKEMDEGTLFKRKTRDPLIQVEGLTRDPFSLHKMMVVLTKSGSFFGIDSLTGNIVWRYFSDDLSMRKNRFFLQRTTAHFPHPPQAVILSLDPDQQGPPAILNINPITGDVTRCVVPAKLTENAVVQVVLLPQADSTFLRPLVLLDSELNLLLIPRSDETEDLLSSSNLYLYDINIESGLIRGFRVPSLSEKAQVTWSVQIPPTHKIIGFAGKLPGEKIDSVGRPLADRSVMFKYLNPNAVTVLSESLERSPDRTSLGLLLLDAVSGQVIHSMTHKKSSGPVHIVQTENWLLYSYRNVKMRRTEISSLEMYEGKVQYNSTAFSSFHSRPSPPMVLQQAYVFPTGISSIGVSRTEKGITSRQILFGLTRGAVFGIHRKMFDPRRSLHPTDAHREEGIIPYSPEIPVPPELFLSYNQTVEKIESIYSAPSALESTSVVLVTGLDLYFTRTQPSKMFDVLKEDFDHIFITVVLVGMFVAALATRRLSQIKQLKKSWR